MPVTYDVVQKDEDGVEQTYTLSEGDTAIYYVLKELIVRIKRLAENG